MLIELEAARARVLEEFGRVEGAREVAALAGELRQLEAVIGEEVGRAGEVEEAWRIAERVWGAWGLTP